jgi:hypothetical protein
MLNFILCDLFRSILSEENALLSEMSAAGIDEASLPELKKQLNEYLAVIHSYNDGAAGYSARTSSDAIDMTALDRVLNDVFNEKSEDTIAASRQEGSSPELTAENLRTLDKASGDVTTDETNDDDSSSSSGSDSSGDSSSSSSSGDDDVEGGRHLTPSASERLSAYKTEPATELERERDMWYAQVEHSKKEDIRNELEMMAFQAFRRDTEIATRARLGRLYEQKEAARRAREWKQRGVWKDEMPMLSLMPVDPHNT